MNITQIVKRVCAWCKKDLGTKEMEVDMSLTMIPPLPEMVTHGMCEDCHKEVVEELPT